MDLPIFALTLPGKIQSYMSSGTTIIGMVNGETAATIREAKCGFTVPSGDVVSFSNLLKTCCCEPSKNMNVLGENGRRYAIQNYAFDSLITKATNFF